MTEKQPARGGAWTGGGGFGGGGPSTEGPTMSSEPERDSRNADSDDLPRHLTEEDVEAAVAESETLYEVTQILRITRRGKARRVLKARGLDGEVRQAGQDWGRP